VIHHESHSSVLAGPTWEIVPHSATLSLDVHITESPDYHARRIWPGYGYLKERAGVCAQWNRRNRAPQTAQEAADLLEYLDSLK